MNSVSEEAGETLRSQEACIYFFTGLQGSSYPILELCPGRIQGIQNARGDGELSSEGRDFLENEGLLEMPV